MNLSLCWLRGQPGGCNVSNGSQGWAVLTNCSTPTWGAQRDKPGSCGIPSCGCVQHHSDPRPVAALGTHRRVFAWEQPTSHFTLQGNFLVSDCLKTLLVVSIFP